MVWARRLAAFALLAACAAPAPPPPSPIPTPAPSGQSAEIARYMQAVENALLARGLLRSDGGGPDTPFDAASLTENFLRIALFDEFARTPSGFVAQETESRLRRFAAPVRVALHFGASVPAAAQARQTAQIRSYLARLARLTGHPISLAEPGANFHIFVVNEDERRALGPTAQALLPGMSAAEAEGLRAMPRTNYCVVYAYADDGAASYTRALAVLRAENPPLLALLCIHEEIAQGLGLANDSPRARPSIFNDDQEFALLTRQDELMLKILYDPRLRPGMSLAEARPVVAALATELLGAGL